MNNKAKILGIIVGVTLFAILMLGVTYAWYRWNTNSEEETLIATDVGTVTVKYDAGASIIGKEIKPVGDKTLGIKKGISVVADKESTNKAEFNLYLDIVLLDEGLKHASFKYELYKSNELVTQGNFANLTTIECNNDNSIEHIILLSGEKITTSVSTYELYIWIDGNEKNPNNMQNQEFQFNLHADGKNAIGEIATYPDITSLQEGTFAYNIVNKYLNSNSYKEETVGNVKYRLDTTNNLVSDVDGNVRYFGVNPNNYVYFNCDTYPETNCETWRIIGVFDDKIKLMKEGYIGDFSYDIDYNDDLTSTTYNNDWQTSSLKELLNNQYLNNENTEYYNYVSGNIVKVDANFNSDKIGIKDKTRPLIADTMYNLGGYHETQPLIYADEFYEYERDVKVASGNSTIWYGKIAIPYLSDVLYASDFRECNTYVLGYNNIIKCLETNWMSHTFVSSGTGQAVFLSMVTDSQSNNGKTHIFSFYYSGGGLAYTRARSEQNVFPVLHLNANTVISDVGDGSENNPYRLIVS